MIAKYEKRISADSGNTTIKKYKNLHNLLHWHTEHEFIYVSEGVVELITDNASYILNCGMSAFLASEEIHCIRGSIDSITHIIKTSVGNEITDNKQLASPVISSFSDAEAFVLKISDEQKKKYGGIVSDCIATQLIAEIFRSEKINISSQKDKQKNKQLLEWITSNCSHITFEDTAEYMNFSKSYFSKYFQTLTGMKFTNYLNILKVSSAIEKITNGEKNMTEISISCGFGTIRSFNRIFKKLTGYTPKSIPADYNFLYTILNTDNAGFDPTLNCSEIIE